MLKWLYLSRFLCALKMDEKLSFSSIRATSQPIMNVPNNRSDIGHLKYKSHSSLSKVHRSLCWKHIHASHTHSRNMQKQMLVYMCAIWWLAKRMYVFSVRAAIKLRQAAMTFLCQVSQRINYSIFFIRNISERNKDKRNAGLRQSNEYLKSGFIIFLRR